MPKSLVLGNGNILLCFDQFGQLRDFYYHYIGLENHIGHGCVHRIGVLVDGCFSWIEEPIWEVTVDYNQENFSSKIRAENKELGIELNFSDLVFHKKNIFLRKLLVKNHWDNLREVKIFFHQQFRIYNTRRRDTAYYDAERKTIVHYEGRRVMLVGGQLEGRSFDEYTVGNYGIEGKEGSWKDAENGTLSRNPIEHGPVDSVIAYDFKLGGKNNKEIDYWIVVDKTINLVTKLHDEIVTKTPDHFRRAAQSFWRAWTRKGNLDFADLDKEIVDFYRTSLFVTRTHTGEKGEIIASGDSDMLQYGKDTYAYVWPRDGAFTAIALDRAGYSNITRSFYEFCCETISEDGYFYHKYLCDRSIGSSWHPWSYNDKKRLAIQEDETALVLYGLEKHYQCGFDLEFIESLYNPLIKKAADFLCVYRDRKTGLPDGSYNIWEQDFGISTFTASSVYGGLMAASNFASLLGKRKDQQRYRRAAQQVRQNIIKYLYNDKTNFFYRRLEIEGKNFKYDERIDISSFFGVFYFNVLDKDDPKLKKAFEVLKDRLFCGTPVGGMIRYEGDEFHRVSETAPSNPWFITSFWKAQYEIACAKTKEELDKAKDAFRWAIQYSLGAGMLSEQIKSDNGEQTSASPLVWSHAEFITTVLDYIKKYRELNASPTPLQSNGAKQ